MTSKLNEYYRRTVDGFDNCHMREGDDHYVALARTLPYAKELGVESILDIGCGTGRALEWYTRELPDVMVAGVDASPDMLRMARQRVPTAHCHLGRAESLPFEDRQFDLVCETGILHHVEDPERCIREMFRVARKAVLISDHNNFAFRGDFAKRVRLALYACGLDRVFTFIKQGFRKQGYSAGDGYWYPYSIFNNFRTIGSLAQETVLLPTRRTSGGRLGNLLLSQSHLAIWAIVRQNG